MVLQAADLRQDILTSIDKKQWLIQLDECVVTKKTNNTHVWTLPKTNITLDQSEIYTKSKAIILAVSREKGLELV